ncbi:MAG: tetratricopeptide repeat protein [Kofleriaceae bacterium]
MAGSLLGALPATADPKQDAAAIARQGDERFQAKSFDEAAKLYEQAYALDPDPAHLFALAQAERLGGHCDRAIEHYKKLIDAATSPRAAEFVQESLQQCGAGDWAKPPEAKPSATPQPPATAVSVVRSTRSSDRLATSMFAGGALALGLGVGLAVTSRSIGLDADEAATSDVYYASHDRADRYMVAAGIAGAVGVGLIGFSVYRWMTGGREQAASVAVVPTTTGATASVVARW